MISLIKTGSGFNAFVDGKAYSVQSSHENYQKLVQAIRDNDVEGFISLVDIKSSLSNYTNGQCVIENDSITINGREVHGSIVNKILEMKKDGFPFEFMMRFLEKLQQNPSSQSKSELYDFIENNGIHITPDGNFLCYKIVKSDFWSKTAGKTVLRKGRVDSDGRIFNGIGEEIECERGEVDDDRRRECSFGLHVGGLSYAGPNGSFRVGNDKCVVVCVNPKDCVSVPLDYGANKLRVSAYKVVSEVTTPMTKSVYNDDGSQLDDYEYNEQDDDDDYEGEPVSEVYSCDEIKFDYEGKVRYLDVDSVDDRYVCGYLMSPEQHEGEYRRFKVEEMTSIYILN